jgi:hypothetical protein
MYPAEELQTSRKRSPRHFRNRLNSEAMMPIMPGRDIDHAWPGMPKSLSKGVFTVDLLDVLQILPKPAGHHPTEEIVLI